MISLSMQLAIGLLPLLVLVLAVAVRPYPKGPSGGLGRRPPLCPQPADSSSVDLFLRRPRDVRVS
jgi:hypothetical protein